MRRMEGEEAWEKIKFWAALWASVSTDFTDIYQSNIILDWKAADY